MDRLSGRSDHPDEIDTICFLDIAFLGLTGPAWTMDRVGLEALGADVVLGWVFGLGVGFPCFGIFSYLSWEQTHDFGFERVNFLFRFCHLQKNPDVYHLIPYNIFIPFFHITFPTPRHSSSVISGT